MKKVFISITLISYLAVSLTPYQLYAASETQGADIDLKKTDVPIPEGDEKFARRSARAQRFTFKEIPRDLGLSLKKSFYGWGGLGFIGGIGLTAALLPLDDEVKMGLGPNQVFNQTTNDVLALVFDPLILGGVSALLWGVGAGTKAPKIALTGRALTEALLLSMGITFITKAIFRRTRPDGGNFSFPSGHATAAFSTAGVLTVFYGWKGALPGYTMATLVSLNRLDSHAHWLTDVVMGAVIGTVVGVGTARFLKSDHPNVFVSAGVNSEQATLHFHYRF